MRNLFIYILCMALCISGCIKKDSNSGDLDQNGDNLGKTDQGKDNLDETEKETEPNENKDLIRQKIDNMNLDEKIGQLMVVGLNGPSVDEHTERMINEYHIGGFILFKYNITDETQMLELTNALKELNSGYSIPLFLSIDEEGGKVTRLPKSFLKLPAAKRIGDANNKTIAFGYGEIIGESLKSLGLNMNYGPVMDINSNPKNPVIGERAFGSVAETVVNSGINAMDGMHSKGIISIVKHFPGHGDTEIDSHKDLPVVNKDMKDLEERELMPFIESIRHGVDGIMVGHILFNKLDNDFPATLSKNIIDGLLRNRLGYEGLVISDDMTMGAIIKNHSIEDASTMFLKAGGDLLLICHGYENQISIFERIKEELNNGGITTEELDEKLYRIIKLKTKYGLKDMQLEETDINQINSETEELYKRIHQGN